jgi:hypothetical protein
MRPDLTIPFLSIVLALSFGANGAPPTEFSEDFEHGLARWDFTDAKAWEVAEDPAGNHVLSLERASQYEPPFRSPLNIALAKDLKFDNFELTVRIKQTGREYGHRDSCVFLGYQDPSHFYYVHLASTADEHANSIFLVNGAARVSIAATRTTGTKWDDKFHNVKVVRDSASGKIEVYFDDMKTPAMTATDKTFGPGRIGVGSFDDTGHFDDIHVKKLDKK